MPNQTRAPDRRDSAIGPIARSYRGILINERLPPTFECFAAAMTYDVKNYWYGGWYTG